MFKSPFLLQHCFRIPHLIPWCTWSSYLLTSSPQNQPLHCSNVISKDLNFNPPTSLGWLSLICKGNYLSKFCLPPQFHPGFLFSLLWENSYFKSSSETFVFFYSLFSQNFGCHIIYIPNLFIQWLSIKYSFLCHKHFKTAEIYQET